MAMLGGLCGESWRRVAESRLGRTAERCGGFQRRSAASAEVHGSNIWVGETFRKNIFSKMAECVNRFSPQASLGQLNHSSQTQEEEATTNTGCLISSVSPW